MTPVGALTFAPSDLWALPAMLVSGVRGGCADRPLSGPVSPVYTKGAGPCWELLVGGGLSWAGEGRGCAPGGRWGTGGEWDAQRGCCKGSQKGCTCPPTQRRTPNAGFKYCLSVCFPPPRPTPQPHGNQTVLRGCQRQTQGEQGSSSPWERGSEPSHLLVGASLRCAGQLHKQGASLGSSAGSSWALNPLVCPLGPGWPWASSLEVEECAPPSQE